MDPEKAELKDSKSTPAAAANGPPSKPVPKARGRFDPPIRSKARPKKPKFYATNDTLVTSVAGTSSSADSELMKLLQNLGKPKSSSSKGKDH